MMVGKKDWGRCPNCGRHVDLLWIDDGTHSPRVDISEYDHMDVCYTEGMEAWLERGEYTDREARQLRKADAMIHLFNDPSEAMG